VAAPSGAVEGAVVQIKLQTSVEEFGESFVQKLALVEQAMIEHGLDPATFVIAKDAAVFNNARAFGATFRDYTVFVADQHFTVTHPSDMHFLEYFYDLCVAPEAAAPTVADPQDGMLGRLLHWMERPT
jgi:hypothetical protein